MGIVVFSGQEKHSQNEADGSELCQVAFSIISPAEDPERKENTFEF